MTRKKTQSQTQPVQAPPISTEKKITGEQELQNAIRGMHGCMNELLKAGRVVSMEAAGAIITDYNIILRRLNEADILAEQVKKLLMQVQHLTVQLQQAQQKK